MAFTVQLEDGTEVLVDKVFEGDDIVLKDEAGNRYQPAQYGAHVVALEAGEAPVAEAQTDTEPVAEEAEETEETAPEAPEEDNKGGVTEEPIG